MDGTNDSLEVLIHGSNHSLEVLIDGINQSLAFLMDRINDNLSGFFSRGGVHGGRAKYFDTLLDIRK